MFTMTTQPARSALSLLSAFLTFSWYVVSGALGLVAILLLLSLAIDSPPWTLALSAIPPRLELTTRSSSMTTSVSAMPPGIDVAHRDGAPARRAGLWLQIPVSISSDRDIVHVAASSIASDDASLRATDAVVTVPAARDAVFVAHAVVLIGTLAAALFLLALVRAVVRSVRADTPFAPANAVRIRQIGLVVIGGEFLRAAVVFGENLYAMRHFTADGLTFNARFQANPLTIISGLAILVIAEVFRQGTRLDEDQSLTV